jgi:AsmA protein
MAVVRPVMNLPGRYVTRPADARSGRFHWPGGHAYPAPVMPSPFQKRWVRVVAIVVAVLVAVVFVLSLVLDSILTKRAQAEAVTLSQQLGRPVSIGRVSTSFLTGLGATVSGLEVGGAPDEGVPLVQVKELGVKVAALRALFSMGKDIVVRSIEVSETMVNVVRLADGTTNLERVQSRLAEQA